MGKFTFQHIYEFPWELVTHTHLTKYPTEKEKNIVGSEVVESKKGGKNSFFLILNLATISISVKRARESHLSKGCCHLFKCAP